MSMSLSVHNVTAIRLEDRSHAGRSWQVLTITSADYAGREETFDITTFPALAGMALRVDQPEDDEDEPDVPTWRDAAGYTDSERQDIRAAGRGHLIR